MFCSLMSLPDYQRVFWLHKECQQACSQKQRRDLTAKHAAGCGKSCGEDESRPADSILNAGYIL